MSLSLVYKGSPIKLSVAIITKNEARNIERCLRSVKWASEIIILDSGSQDETLQIAEKYTAKIHSKPWPGYSQQKQRAIDLCTGDWVLSLDADEELSPELQREIQRTLKKPLFKGYRLPRRLVFRGKVLHYSEGSSLKFRLFARGLAKMNAKLVHEELFTTEKLGTLNNIMYHHSFFSLTELIEKMNHYSSLGAKEKQKQNAKSSLLKAIIRGYWTFFRVYFLQRAFLDGALGFIYSVHLAESSYYRYLKMLFPERSP